MVLIALVRGVKILRASVTYMNLPGTQGREYESAISIF